MSRNERRIRKSFEAKGYIPKCVSWAPITAGPEMGGPEGGWYIEYEMPDGEREGFIIGYNIQEVLENIAKLPNLKV